MPSLAVASAFVWPAPPNLAQRAIAPPMSYIKSDIAVRHQSQSQAHYLITSEIIHGM
jgi:hypothetical protein